MFIVMYLLFYMHRSIDIMKQSLIASNINFLKLFIIQCLNNQTTFFFMNQVVESFELVMQLIWYIYMYIYRPLHACFGFL